ncbi:hypothetical protein C2G38_2103494, partial [Gigaspora rosea]
NEFYCFMSFSTIYNRLIILISSIILHSGYIYILVIIASFKSTFMDTCKQNKSQNLDDNMKILSCNLQYFAFLLLNIFNYSFYSFIPFIYVFINAFIDAFEYTFRFIFVIFMAVSKKNKDVQGKKSGS